MQVKILHKEIDLLQDLHGDHSLKSVYGAGCINTPKVMFIFMNPTAKNISANKDWSGLRAPWLGTRNVWGIFFELGFLSEDIYKEINTLPSSEWSEGFCKKIYSHLESNSVFITNFAKCTQLDARPLKDNVFKNYLDLIKKEIFLVRPEKIITFGNQVSSNLLNKKISVSEYQNTENELLEIKNIKFKVYPTFYPVGQGRRNMPKAIKRIKKILTL